MISMIVGLERSTSQRSTQVAVAQWQIVQHLPDLSAQILDRLVGDTNFQSLYHDYATCAEALGRFRQQSDDAAERVAEYEQLLAELEHDVRRALDIK